MDSGIVCSPSELEGCVKRIVEEKIRLVDKGSTADTIDVGNECVEELKSTSPYDPDHRGRHYRSGWRAKADDSEDGFTMTIYNSKKPGLTHLLEHGHGGPAPAGAHPHIGPAADHAIAELNRRMSG